MAAISPWVSIRESRPAIGTYVLVWWDSPDLARKFFVARLHHDSDGWWWIGELQLKVDDALVYWAYIVPPE